MVATEEKLSVGVCVRHKQHKQKMKKLLNKLKQYVSRCFQWLKDRFDYNNLQNKELQKYKI